MTRHIYHPDHLPPVNIKTQFRCIKCTQSITTLKNIRPDRNIDTNSNASISSYGQEFQQVITGNNWLNISNYVVIDNKIQPNTIQTSNYYKL